LEFLVASRRFSSWGAADYRSLMGYKSYTRMKDFVRRSTFAPFRRFLKDVRCELMLRGLSVVLHGTLSFCLRYALQEGAAATVACLAPCSADLGFFASRSLLFILI
jgi:hypothetical protein